MELKEKFENAVQESEGLSSRPSNEDLLKLYALYKQATIGDNSMEPPGGFDFKAAAKYNAWAAIKGKGHDDAMAGYIDLIESLKS
jgi:diazepam-binding inhibitor (GABA receptor modulator, acyl-CoA-binding protein)